MQMHITDRGKLMSGLSGSLRLAAVVIGLYALGLCAAPAQVVINEIMYHPYEPWPSNQPAKTTNLTEYVEIHNAGSQAVDLGEYRFDNGIDFNFSAGTLIPAGGYLVVCENLEAFTNAYPTVTAIAGEFNGGLDNGGERVTLSRRTNDQWVTVDSIRYIDGGTPDGGDRSLELVHPGFSRFRDQFYGAWAPSTAVGGTPGVVNSIYNPDPPPVIGNVEHDPPLPFPDAAVTITCQAGDHEGGELLEIILRYRKDQDPQVAYQECEMYDNGLNGDDIAADGIYTRILPQFYETAMQEGDLLEFTIRATNTNGVPASAPAENTAGVLSGPYSYFCKFGDDSGYDGEYDTYHILTSAVNKNELESRDLQSDELLDATLVTADGEIFYNCGLRFRGGSSRNSLYGGYRIELPRGRTYESYREINLNHLNALSQYVGLSVCGNLGYGAHSQEAELSRVWLNDEHKVPTSEENYVGQGIYVRIEGFDSHIVSRTTGNNDGNMYKSDGDGYNGDLSYSSDINEYINNTVGDSIYNYITAANNPYTVYYDLQDLCWGVNRPRSELPTVLPQRLNVRSWARLYAVNVCMANDESGWLDPWSTRGDELRIYRNTATGQFELYPWDMDSIFTLTTSGVWEWDNGYNTPTRNFLFNPPMGPYYIGDVLDIFETTMSDAAMAALWDSMGTALADYPNVRSGWQTTVTTLRAAVNASISTDLTVNVSPAPVAQGPQATIVTSGSVGLSGRFPQNYTAQVLVNGQPANWTSWDVASMQSTYGKWSTPANLALTNPVTEVLVQAVDSEGQTLQQKLLRLVRKTGETNHSGVVSANTTWDSAGGTIVVTGNVTVVNGATLTIADDSLVLVDDGISLNVVDGALVIDGNADRPVQFLSSNGSSAWSIQATGSAASVTARFARLRGGSVDVSANAELLLEDCFLSQNTSSGGIIGADGASSATIRRCTVTDYGSTLFTDTPLLIERSLFEGMSLAGIAVSGGTSVLRRNTLRLPASAGAVDGILFSGAYEGSVSNCLVQGMGGSGVKADSSGVALTVAHNVLEDCGEGLTRGSHGSLVLTARNNTIIGCDAGVQGAVDAFANGIVWSNTVSINSGPAQVSHSDVAMAGIDLYAGPSNLNRPPWFRDPAAGDYRLQSISPCIDAGDDGQDMGPAYPVGAVPAAPDGLSVVAELVSNTNRMVLSWNDNSDDETGFEVQRLQADGTWLTVAAVDAGVTLAYDEGLAQDTAYSYRVRALHDRGSSLYSYPVTTLTHLATTTQALVDAVRFSEIMYHPADPVSSPYTDADCEFLEIKNMGAGLLDMSGVYFSAGLTFTFPNGTVLAPGGFFVLVRNPAAFAERYPGVAYQGVFESGALDNGGETLRLKDAGGNTITAADYGDGNSTDWYPTTDGEGYSLVLADHADPLPDPDLPGTWRASAYVHGSPGQDDPNPPDGTVAINEVFSHTDPPVEDAIELYNGGLTAVNVGNWYLSNSSADLRRYQIPADTWVPAGGYRVFYEGTSFNQSPGNPGNFEISSLGDEVYLSSASGTNLTSFRTWVKFGAAENGVSFGRHVTSDGKADFVAQSAHSFGVDNPSSTANFRTGTGKTNYYPMVGPVVISEIMYNPSAGGKEFVEIANITASPAPLYDPAVPTNTWRFNGAMEYVFPTGTVLAAGEHLVVTSIDPQEFRDRFGITNPAIQVLGPFDGSLDNAGDSLKLYKPDPPELSGFVPYVLADRVKYNDSLPWPEEADNGGPSLEKIDLSAYGNDPTNWHARTVGGTPGAANNTSGLPSVSFDDPAGTGLEGNLLVKVPVVLSPAATGLVTVAYSLGGTAVAGQDYSLAPATLTFWPHDTLKTIPLQILQNGIGPEPDKTVIITLETPSGALQGGNRVYTYTIQDTDGGALAAPSIIPNGANFLETISVTLETAVTGGEIFYTLDGSIPTREDEAYFGPLQLSHSARIKARTFLGENNGGTVASAVFLEKTPLPESGPNAVDQMIQASSDDAEQQNTRFNLVQLDALSLSPGYYTISSSSFTYLGLRFDNVALSPGMVITEAYVQFTAAAAGSGDTATTIYGEAHDDSPTFTTAARNISDRATTTSSVLWEPFGWGAAGERGVLERTPDLSAIINEIISRPGWTSNNAVTLIFENHESVSFRSAASYDGDLAKAPMLHVEFEQDSTDDGDGMPDWWEELYNLDPNDAGDALIDTDGDGLLNIEEYEVDTIPIDPLSVLKFTGLQPADSAGVEIAWQSSTNIVYSVYKTADVRDGWSAPALRSNIWGGASGTTRYVDVSAEFAPGFFRVTGQRPGPLSGDADLDGLPDYWEVEHFAAIANGLPEADWDLDGRTNAEELEEGTDPTDPDSYLRPTDIIWTPQGVIVSWTSESDRLYDIYRTYDLLPGWPPLPLQSDIPGHPSGITTYLDSDTGASAYYRILGRDPNR